MPFLRYYRPATAEIGLHQHDIADGFIRQQLAQLRHDREITRPESVHQEKLPFARAIDHHLRFFGVDGEGLFAEHMLAGIQAKERMGQVIVMRRGDIGDIDIGVIRQFFVAAVAFAGAVFRAECVGIYPAIVRRRRRSPNPARRACSWRICAQ